MANLSAKGTVLIASGPRHDPERRHLFIICTDADENGEQLLLSVSSVRTDVPHDPTCILQDHEHRFVKRPSFVFYARPIIKERRALEKGVEEGHLAPDEDINGQVFLRVVNGIERSPQTPRKIKSYYAARKLATAVEAPRQR